MNTMWDDLFEMRGRVCPLRVVLAAAVVVVLAGTAFGQSSSLYMTDAEPANGIRTVPVGAARAPVEAPRVSPQVVSMSLSAVPVPEPRTYAIGDLLTVIIRESTDTSIEASLDTEKGFEIEGEIAELPRLTLTDLLNFQLKPNTFEDGTPQLDVSLDHEFEGEGAYERRDSMISRIQARVIDVKPNGTLIVEARKRLQSDDEVLTVSMFGTCRVEDITVDNTILSTQLFDLSLNQQHEGEVKKSTKKGLITGLLELLFNV